MLRGLDKLEHACSANLGTRVLRSHAASELQKSEKEPACRKNYPRSTKLPSKSERIADNCQIKLSGRRAVVGQQRPRRNSVVKGRFAALPKSQRGSCLGGLPYVIYIQLRHTEERTLHEGKRSLPKKKTEGCPIRRMPFLYRGKKRWRASKQTCNCRPRAPRKCRRIRLRPYNLHVGNLSSTTGLTRIRTGNRQVQMPMISMGLFVNGMYKVDRTGGNSNDRRGHKVLSLEAMTQRFSGHCPGGNKAVTKCQGRLRNFSRSR